MRYNSLMDGPSPPPLFPPDAAVVHSLISLTFLVQAVVIGFHARLSRHFSGIRTYLIATLLLAAGGLIPSVDGWLRPPVSGLLSALLTIWGAALQVLAVTRFLKRRISRYLVWGWPAVTTVLIVGGFLAGAPPPLLAFRELLPIPLLVVATVALYRADTRTFRTGAILTGIPFAIYAVRNLIRFVQQLSQGVQEGPDFGAETTDALVYFVFNFLWTSGFLMMINQRLQSSLETLATEDPLTGCLNRRAMSLLLEGERLRHLRHGRPFAIVLMDLDRFKAINDTRGHEAGDQVLIKTTAAMRHELRDSDAVARWGGEEFLVLLPETDDDAAVALAERLRALVAGLAFEQPGLSVTISGGVAGVRGEESVADLCRRADQALYEAKKTRNRIVTA